MTDHAIPATIRDRLLASARRLLAAAERPDSTERCHACGFHPRGRMDGVPTFGRTDSILTEGIGYVRLFMPVSCAGCGAQSTAYVSALLHGDEIVESPARSLFNPDLDDPCLCRQWRVGRSSEPPTIETFGKSADKEQLHDAPSVVD